MPEAQLSAFDLAADDRSLWIRTGASLLRFDPTQRRVTTTYRLTGPEAESVGSSLVVTRDSLLCFGPTSVHRALRPE